MPRTRADRDARLTREMEERRRRVEEEKRRLAEKDTRTAEEELPYVLLLLENFRCGKIPIDPYDIIDNPETYGSIWVRAAKMLIEEKSLRSEISEISVVEVSLTNVLIDVDTLPYVIESVCEVNEDLGMSLLVLMTVDVDDSVTLSNMLIDVDTLHLVTINSVLDDVVEHGVTLVDTITIVVDVSVSLTNELFDVVDEGGFPLVIINSFIDVVEENHGYHWDVDIDFEGVGNFDSFYNSDYDGAKVYDSKDDLDFDSGKYSFYDFDLYLFDDGDFMEKDVGRRVLEFFKKLKKLDKKSLVKCRRWCVTGFSLIF